LLAGLDLGILADDDDGLGVIAYLVAAAGAGDHDVQGALGHLAERAVERGQRTRDGDEGEDHRTDQRQHHQDGGDQVQAVGI
jgi:hypothetical protein